MLKRNVSLVLVLSFICAFACQPTGVHAASIAETRGGVTYDSVVEKGKIKAFINAGYEIKNLMIEVAFVKEDGTCDGEPDRKTKRDDHLTYNDYIKHDTFAIIVYFYVDSNLIGRRIHELYEI